jgi:D-glycero-alpha-D-manno-heptose-7-phosphate kinase
MLYFTGVTRIASDIAANQIRNFDKVANHYKKIRELVDEGLTIMEKPKASLAELGKLLHESWLLKRELSDNITNPQIDAIYKSGLDAGVIGGKILGAGGGGFILFFADPKTQPKIREKFKHLIEVPFNFESDGSKIVLDKPNGFI